MAPQIQKFSPTTDERRVNSLKKRVQHAYNSNIITLVQKRHGDLDYEYIAVRVKCFGDYLGFCLFQQR